MKTNPTYIYEKDVKPTHGITQIDYYYSSILSDNQRMTFFRHRLNT